jgi:2-polyprenyl-6-hydroxyphenyl methylase / 3-demethylubiquinone-9 3-methyltransferase
MPVDNQLYDRLADTWWSENSVLAMLRVGLNPARFGYMREVIVDRLGIDPRGVATLDVGSGGGLLAEEFAHLGCRVTGIDPSEESVEAARAHARESGLEIEYVSGVGEDLPFDDGAFGIVYCCDVLEHVDDLDRVISESARVLRPGGLYLYDTLNRTARSKLIAIKLMQEWRATAFMEPDLHDWKMFIKPVELEAVLARHGLENRDLAGISPGRNPVALIREMRRRVRGEISYADLGRRIAMRKSRDTSVIYAGYALKADAGA